MTKKLKVIDKINKDISEIGEGYISIINRLERFSENTKGFLVLPVNTYELLFLSINDYINAISYKKEDINEILKNTKDENNRYHLLLAVKRLNILFNQFLKIIEKIKLVKDINKDKEKENNINIFNIKSKKELEQNLSEIEILKIDIGIYKNLQKKFSTKLDLDNKEEKEIEKNIDFIEIESNFVNKYINKFYNIKNHKNDILIKLKNNNIILDKKLLDYNLDKEYILSLKLDTLLDKDLEDIKNRYIYISDFILLLIELDKDLTNLKNVNSNIKINEFSFILKNIKTILDKKQYKSIKDIEDTILTIDGIYKDFNVKNNNYFLQSIIDILTKNNNGINYIKNIIDINYKNVKLDKYLDKINDNQFSILKEFSYKKASNNYKKELLDNAENEEKIIENIKSKIKKHIKLLDYYLDNSYNLSENILSIENEILNYNFRINNNLKERRINSILSLKDILSKKMKKLSIDIDMLKIKELLSFYNKLEEIKEYKELEIQRINSEINDINHANEKIVDYSYNNSGIDDFKEYVYSYLPLTSSATINMFESRLMKKYNEEKEEYEYQKKLERKREREEEDRLERKRREEERNSYNSYSSSDDWSFSSSSSSSFSDSYGGSDSF